VRGSERDYSIDCTRLHDDSPVGKEREGKRDRKGGGEEG
jgi:hypothetical protein